LLEAVFDSGFHQQAIDNDFDGVFLRLSRRDRPRGSPVHRRRGRGKNMLDELLHLFFKFAFAAAHDGAMIMTRSSE